MRMHKREEQSDHMLPASLMTQTRRRRHHSQNRLLLHQRSLITVACLCMCVS